jgi:hypothetical protein
MERFVMTDANGRRLNRIAYHGFGDPFRVDDRSSLLRLYIGPN